MKVLGISSNYHDASAALVVDGEVVSASAEERFTIQKHDPSFPLLSARFCVEQAGISFSDLDLVVYHEDPAVKFTRSISTSLLRFPFSRKTFVKSMSEAVTTGFWIKHEISKKFDIHPDKISYMPHHFSHAAHVFLASPFESAAVLTIDAVGEWTSTSLFRGGKKEALELVDLIPFPHSLGLIYSAFTAFLGFKVNDGECSTMALAAFGEPRFADSVRNIIQVKSDGTYAIESSFFDFTSWDRIPVTKKFTDLFGMPRKSSDPIPFDCFSDSKEVRFDSEMQRFADVAASIQMVLEEAVLALAKRIKQLTGERNLCLGGGVALNCVANGKLLEAGIFEEIFIAPDPGDGGGAMGAALYGSFLKTGKRNKDFRLHPYLGKSYSDRDLPEVFKFLHPQYWKAFSQVPDSSYKGVSLHHYENFEELTAVVAEELRKGKVIGWFQGRFENGPRALGSRSILIDPANIETARRLSKTVKHRAAFRPYALSITEEASKNVLKGKISWPHRWMHAASSVHEDYIHHVRAALHVDHTTRPQICSRDENPRFHQLLNAFGKSDRIPALLNTSFNERGLPIVASPPQALAMFARTSMDILVIENTVMRKYE